MLSQGLDSFLSPPAASRRAAWEGISWGSRASPDRSIQLLRVSNGGRGNGGDVGQEGCRWVGVVGAGGMRGWEEPTATAPLPSALSPGAGLQAAFLGSLIPYLCGSGFVQRWCCGETPPVPRWESALGASEGCFLGCRLSQHLGGSCNGAGGQKGLDSHPPAAFCISEFEGMRAGGQGLL